MSDETQIKNSNGGFTLVELIVSFAILAVVSIMIMLLIQSSANTYRNISGDINLQYESQTAMSQLQDYIIDCNTAVAVTSDSGTLYIFNKLDDTHYKAYKFMKSTSSDELYLYGKSVAASFSKTDSGIFTFSDAQLMSSYVKQFTAAVSPDVKSVSITISYAIGAKTYIARQTISLRNSVENISSYSY